MIYKVLMLTVMATWGSCTHSADMCSVTFLSKDPILAAKEKVVIDWALKYVAHKFQQSKVAEGIENEAYSYYREGGDTEVDDNLCATQVERMSCPFSVEEKLRLAKHEADYNFLLSLLIKDATHDTKAPYVADDAQGRATFQTESVLLVRGPKSCYINGLKNQGMSEYYPNPTIFVQVLIDRDKDACQNKANKQYLLERLRTVCTKSKM